MCKLICPLNSCVYKALGFLIESDCHLKTVSVWQIIDFGYRGRCSFVDTILFAFDKIWT